MNHGNSGSHEGYDAANLDAALVARLVRTQFPAWAELPVVPVEPGGWDNRTFRLGEALAVRLPSSAAYVPQVEKEQRWLPRLAPALPLAIPEPVALGAPAHGYAWPWSIRRWIEGRDAASTTLPDLPRFAADLGGFLAALQRAPATGGPPAGAHNFHRGGALSTYDGETREAVAALGDTIDGAAALGLWDVALESMWRGAPVWVHGDVAPGNLLLAKGKLSAVIDFGSSAVGDPACDLAIAWTLFHGESYRAFRGALALDEETWQRGRGWALWKAVITVAGLPGVNPHGLESARAVLVKLLGR